MNNFFPHAPTAPHRTSHLMFDLETVGTRPTSAILSIGAVIFDPYTPVQSTTDLKEYSFYRTINLPSCYAAGLTYDQATLDWWATQSEDAQKALTLDNRPLTEVLQEFLVWLSNHPFRITGYWANSPSFDRVILENALTAIAKRWPIPFWGENDVRTLKRVAWPNNNAPNFREGTHHNALDDAIAQCRLVQCAHEKLSL